MKLKQQQNLRLRWELSITLILNLLLLVHGLSSRHYHSTIIHKNEVIGRSTTTAAAISSSSSATKQSLHNNHDDVDLPYSNLRRLRNRRDKFSPLLKLPPSFSSSLLSCRTRTKLYYSNKTNEEGIDTVTKDDSKSTLLTLFISSFASIIILAKLNLIGPYTTNDLILKDASTAILSTILALVFVKSITRLAAQNILQPRDSRKIIHSLSAPLFMLLWPFFNTDIWGSRLFAASVPFLQGSRLWLAAINKGGKDGFELSNAISRSGKQVVNNDPFS